MAPPDRTPWGVLVSEVMLQQTPVRRVEPVWRTWMERWPTPTDLAAASPGDAVRAWERLGYPRRALRLHAAATQIRGPARAARVPDQLDELRALDGIGEYTAAAVATFAFGQRHAVLDTNVRRVLARVVQGQRPARPALTAAERRLAESLLPDDDATAARWAIAVMELGALVCTARAPQLPGLPDRGPVRVAAGRRHRRTTDRRGAARPGTAPTGRCAAGCSPSCGRRLTRCRCVDARRTPCRTTSCATRTSATGAWPACVEDGLADRTAADVRLLTYLPS